MRTKWIAGGLLSLAAGALLGGETLSLTFEKPQNLTAGAKTVNIRGGNSEGFLVCGKQGLTIPAETLVGEQGTLLFEFKQEKPSEKERVNRHLLTLRCKSRMRADLYMVHDSNTFRFHFGDLSGDVYHVVKPPFEYGKTYYAGIVWTGTRVQFYMDGKLIGDYKQPKKMENVMAINLGPFKDGWVAPEPWGDDTMFKKLKVFNIALTPADVAKECGIPLKNACSTYPGVMCVPSNRKKRRHRRQSPGAVLEIRGFPAGIDEISATAGKFPAPPGNSCSPRTTGTCIWGSPTRSPPETTSTPEPCARAARNRKSGGPNRLSSI